MAHEVGLPTGTLAEAAVLGSEVDVEVAVDLQVRMMLLGSRLAAHEQFDHLRERHAHQQSLATGPMAVQGDELDTLHVGPRRSPDVHEERLSLVITRVHALVERNRGCAAVELERMDERVLDTGLAHETLKMTLDVPALVTVGADHRRNAATVVPLGRIDRKQNAESLELTHKVDLFFAN